MVVQSWIFLKCFNRFQDLDINLAIPVCTCTSFGYERCARYYARWWSQYGAVAAKGGSQNFEILLWLCFLEACLLGFINSSMLFLTGGTRFVFVLSFTKAHFVFLWDFLCHFQLSLWLCALWWRWWCNKCSCCAGRVGWQPYVSL